MVVDHIVDFKTNTRIYYTLFPFFYVLFNIMGVISRSLRNRNGGRPGKRSTCPSIKSLDECSANL